MSALHQHNADRWLSVRALEKLIESEEGLFFLNSFLSQHSEPPFSRWRSGEKMNEGSALWDSVLIQTA